MCFKAIITKAHLLLSGRINTFIAVHLVLLTMSYNYGGLASFHYIRMLTKGFNTFALYCLSKIKIGCLSVSSSMCDGIVITATSSKTKNKHSFHFQATAAYNNPSRSFSLYVVNLEMLYTLI